ncbi:LPS export ABC transporter permease LptG [Aliikangiella coralliicola]|uniref:LPS export ABC transporter permease LptG n=1 Tax=Aliikangiella coralliicola TaxID=2592383 RepID=A0A545UAG8_9GAMM|nr:LPS export ABC transporter permease LptG [Aliikangiella coralliicola]TQV86460.1 LPS export ABC transporter permease LptG [Aliikangiella coralliicola]
MFNLIDRYIGRQIILASTMILLLLACLQSLFSFIDELGRTGRGSYEVSDALLFVGLMLPSRVLELFPMSVLIGSLFGLGNMAANSELTVMRAAGVTTWRIAGAAVKASLILMVLAIIIGEWVSPISTKAAQQLKTAAISGGELSFSKTGLWARRDNEIIQMGNLLSDGQLKDVTIYQLSDNNRLKGIVKADSAKKQGEHWELYQITELKFLADQIQTHQEEKRIWLNPLQHEQLETLTLEPDTLNIPGLLRYLDYLSENGLETKTYELALWRKLVQPLAICVMMFLAASFVFGPMRNVSMGARIVSGVMLGFGFHIANQSFGPISLVFNLWPALGATIPVLMFALLGYWLMKQNS